MTVANDREPAPPHSAAPNGVSVVIPTINRAEVLVDTVKDLLDQDFRPYEIIIVDQSDEVNATVLDLLRDSPVPARYFKAGFRGLPQARNFGWQQAWHDIVLYIDDDIRTTAGFVAAHHAAHARTGAAMVAGGIDESGSPATAGPTGTFKWWTATPVANFAATTAGPCEHVKGCNFSVQRQALQDIGGFDEALTIGAALYEELETALRMNSSGRSAWFEPTARLTHLAAPMGGCRVPRDVPRYMHGLAHNRGILIYRHLKPWHRPTAIARLLLLGLSYAREDRSLGPLRATFTGLKTGRAAALQPPTNSNLQATECTRC